MKKHRLGAWFYILTADEVIPKDFDAYMGSTRVIRPGGEGYEIVRHEPGEGWQRRPEIIFESVDAALSWGYEDYCKEESKLGLAFK